MEGALANLTVVVDDEVLQRARLRALKEGTSVNAIVRDELERYAAETEAERAAGVASLRALWALADELAPTDRPPITARDWTREELHDREGLRRHEPDRVRSRSPRR